MQKTDLELQEAVIFSMRFAHGVWIVGSEDGMARDFIEELSVRGYKIVKDTEE